MLQFWCTTIVAGFCILPLLRNYGLFESASCMVEADSSECFKKLTKLTHIFLNITRYDYLDYQRTVPQHSIGG